MCACVVCVCGGGCVGEEARCCSPLCCVCVCVCVGAATPGVLLLCARALRASKQPAARREKEEGGKVLQGERGERDRRQAVPVGVVVVVCVKYRGTNAIAVVVIVCRRLRHQKAK